MRIVDEDSRRQSMAGLVVELGIGGNLRRRVDLLRGRLRIGCTLKEDTHSFTFMDLLECTEKAKTKKTLETQKIKEKTSHWCSSWLSEG